MTITIRSGAKEKTYNISDPKLHAIFTSTENSYARDIDTEKELFFAKGRFWPGKPLPTSKYQISLLSLSSVDYVQYCLFFLSK